ncbi:protein of unknown function UPF0102 [Gloeothece citriformis PCC 7424]|uniref:UPF0102 protein PCC7424_1324 n=1 Tax=Gloeothece citriformis (strain PCC 7424) TaxID=65393 RepID=B7K7K1_GLOC7|nr:YraN family protein [Gloeothece citriformis]ACK69769.1 protein of unknown function UPF0102 [Gloeothece citriformis PCC 7424]
MTTIGELGEKLVSEWLKTQEWSILQHRWRCRWGEIDIISQSTTDHSLAFIEVKTRNSRNWDSDGLLAINEKKQIKLIKSASLFLGEYPSLALFPCRFDVALVSYKKAKSSLSFQGLSEISLGKSVFWEGYQLTLNQYLESAFEVNIEL